MQLSILSLANLALIVAVASALSGQPLAGVYTCANGNPGNSYDYGDIGDFFTALESHGVGGPVTLHVYDDGGPFQSAATYSLGSDWLSGALITRPVVGVNLNSRITIRAADGEFPVIQGSSAYGRFIGSTASTSAPYSPHNVGSMAFENVGFTTVEGLTFTGGGAFGVYWYSTIADSCDHVIVRRCTFNNFDGCAISFLGRSLPIHNGRIENNMIWDCRCTFGGSNHSWCVVSVNQSGFEWVVVHNTIVIDGSTSGIPPRAFHHSPGSAGMPWSVCSGNIVHLSTPNQSYVYLATSRHPINCDYNVYFLSGEAKMSSVGAGPYFTWQQWQAAGHDPNGLNTDPLLVSVAPGTEDLRLSPNSPARDLIPFGVPKDIFGNNRPSGPRFDAGAHEFLAPLMAVEQSALPVAHNGTFHTGPLELPGDNFDFMIRNVDQADLILTGSPRVFMAPGLNCGPGTAITAQPPLGILPPATATAFTLRIEPLAAGPFDLTISIASNDFSSSPYTFTVSGNAFVNGPAAARPALGSTFLGPINGPLVLALNQGAALVDAVVELFDAEANSITVLSVLPPPVLLAGVVPPTFPTPGHPIMLPWTGTVDAQAVPGDYTWQIAFQDSVNGAIVPCEVTIRVNHPPPPNLAAVADVAAGSVFSGPQNGPFALTLAPGAALAGAGIQLSDPEGDAVTLLSIAPPALLPAGITAPTLPAPGHPLNLAWTGQAAATNPPGVYLWQLEFRDAVNQTPMQCSVQITIEDLPPNHTPAGTITGNGSQAAPYECVYIRGDGAALQTALCTVTDANTGQNPFISQSIRAPANPGAVDFVFTLNAGALTVAPDAMLTVAEAGQHDYEVRLSDGTNSVGVHVSITVANPPMFFLTPAQLPAGQTSQPWNANLVVTGNIGAVSFAITAGSLPTGLDMDTAGQISGTPGATGDASFTVQAQDATGATASRAFTLTIQPTPQPPDTGPGSGSTRTGCVAGTASSLWVLLPLLVLVRAIRREDR